MNDARPASPRLLPLGGILFGVLVAAGAALVVVGVLGVARGEAVDGFAALGVAGLLLAVFAARFVVRGRADASAVVARATTVVTFSFVAFGAYFVVRVWRQETPLVSLGFVGATLALSLGRRALLGAARRRRG